MNSSFNLQQTGDDHLRERQQERLLLWAENIFAEPKPESNGINPRLYELGYISQEQEAVLYRDLHSRDSEVGVGLLNWRKAELLDSLAYLRNAIKKRDDTASLARSRRETLERLAPEMPMTKAQAEVESDLQIELSAELERLETKLKLELIYLRSYGTKVDALERMLKLVGSESALRIPRASEQMLRLFSQSWRGFVKIKSWALRFGESAHMPSLQSHKQPGEPAGFLL